MRLLDLFCGAGGAAVGYHRAGFDEIVGVDINPQPHYPFEFVQGSALALPNRWKFDLIHASPPCQHFTKYRNVVKDITDRYEDLIAPTRELLEASGVPYWPMTVRELSEAIPPAYSQFIGEQFLATVEA